MRHLAVLGHFATFVLAPVKKVHAVIQLVVDAGLAAGVWSVASGWSVPAKGLAILGLLSLFLLVAVVRLHWRQHPAFVFQPARLDWISGSGYMLKMAVKYNGFFPKSYRAELLPEGSTGPGIGIGWTHRAEATCELGGRIDYADIRIGWVIRDQAFFQLVPTGPGDAQFDLRPAQPLVDGSAFVVKVVSGRSCAEKLVRFSLNDGPWGAALTDGPPPGGKPTPPVMQMPPGPTPSEVVLAGDDLKEKVLQLADEINRFIGTRNRHDPSTNVEWHSGEIDEAEQERRFRERTQRIINYSMATMANYDERFAARALAVFDQLSRRGLLDPQDRWSFEQPTNPLGIRQIGQVLGAVGHQL